MDPEALDPTIGLTGGVVRRGADGDPAERAGATIGRYQLIEEIGAGGFGSVFAAEQLEPVVRRVALKIIKLGMDTQAVIARFEQERQSLAMMDHPHIAKVLDAGTTDSGRPFFVMELVEGQPITEYADEHLLTVRERLELFLQVCAAIQHAHSKGIIHRDIKPGNVLVSTHDGRPFARVIDFGIAKAVEQAQGIESGFTMQGQMIGTPLYMSPEQASGSLDIDTRSDVFALGVLLYELLTGRTPLDPDRLRTAAFDEVFRIVRESEPPRPSTRLAATVAELPSVAARRSTAPERLRTSVRGELDWIAMKALEKDRARRYQTVNGLGLDIQRFLAGEAVEAVPPSTAYRVRKLMVRHKGPVIAAAAVLVALVTGLAGTLWQSRVAARERDAARQEAARATALNDFMSQMLTAADPSSQGDREVTVAEVLERASAAAEANLEDQPAAEAAARTLLGSTFQSLGKVDEATRELERALALHRADPGPAGAPMATTLSALAGSYTNKGEYEKAVAATREAIAILSGLGPAYRRELVGAYWLTGRSEYFQSHYERALAAVDRGDSILALLGEDLPRERAQNFTLRGFLALRWQGDLGRASELLGAALAEYRTTGDRVQISDALSSLALVEMEIGHLDSAATLLGESVQMRREVFGDESPFLAMSLENLANVRYRQGDFTRAADLLAQVLAIREPIYGADSFPMAKTRFNTGSVMVRAGQYDEALRLIDDALVVFQQHTGEKSSEVIGALQRRAECLIGLGDDRGALVDCRRALAISEEIDGPGTPSRLSILWTLAGLLCRSGATVEARTKIDAALASLEPGSVLDDRWRPIFEKLLAECGD